MERRRERLISALREQGYEATWPEGTFYSMVRSPIADDEAFARILNRHKVLVLPGTIVESPGWFRISLTASDEMVERGIPAFGAAKCVSLKVSFVAGFGPIVRDPAESQTFWWRR